MKPPLPPMPRMGCAALRERTKTLVPKKQFTTPLGADKKIVAGGIYLVASPQNVMRFTQSVSLAMELASQTKVFYINATRSEDDVALVSKSYSDDLNNFETFYLEAPDLALRFDEVQTAAVEAGAEIIVIGSFEYAASSARHRSDLAVQILQLSKLGIAVVVFTAEHYKRLLRISDMRRGPLGLLSSETTDIWNMGGAEPDDPNRAGYLDIMQECEQERIDSPPPTPNAIDQKSYEEFTGVPIEQVLPESDWDNPLYTQYPHMCEIIKELRSKKKHDLLRLDPSKNAEYIRNRDTDGAIYNSLVNKELHDV